MSPLPGVTDAARMGIRGHLSLIPWALHHPSTACHMVPLLPWGAGCPVAITPTLLLPHHMTLISLSLVLVPSLADKATGHEHDTRKEILCPELLHVILRGP